MKPLISVMLCALLLLSSACAEGGAGAWGQYNDPDSEGNPSESTFIANLTSRGIVRKQRSTIDIFEAEGMVPEYLRGCDAQAVLKALRRGGILTMVLLREDNP